MLSKLAKAYKLHSTCADKAYEPDTSLKSTLMYDIELN